MSSYKFLVFIVSEKLPTLKFVNGRMTDRRPTDRQTNRPTDRRTDDGGSDDRLTFISYVRQKGEHKITNMTYNDIYIWQIKTRKNGNIQRLLTGSILKRTE